MFDALLIANRGEIARRIVRTCRALGVRSVAVHSEIDADSPFVREADEAVLLGPAPAAESYLRIDRLLQAARERRVAAVHPGYGFLAENAGFAAAVEGAGLCWVGPRATTIQSLGSKVESRRMAASVGVPVLPASIGLAPDDGPGLLRAAEAMGYPVIVKLSGGGGGIGMARVSEPGRLQKAVAAAARRGAASFGDATVYLERYVERGRHVEVQILFDGAGRGIHLFERDCSIQRRHQKVIEEGRPPGLHPETLLALQQDALSIGRAVGYENAGTVEFLVEPDGRHWFLEVNTRIQVEHPVTEAITGLDLVALQLGLAAGDSVLPKQEDVVAHGHAVELRLCAEDPVTLLPAPGKVQRFVPPDGLRVDHALCDGMEVSPFYDSLLAKLVAWGPDRHAAIDAACDGIERTILSGVVHNGPLLRRVLLDAGFRQGDTHTGLLPALLAASPGGGA